MSLRTKLVISFTGLLLLVILTVGFIATRSVEGILVAQIDRTLVGFMERGPIFRSFPPPAPGGDSDEVRAGDEQFLRPIAEVVVDEAGAILAALPSGFTDDPDPLPDVSALPEGPGPVFLPSVDDSLEYRAVIATGPDGTQLVRAAPLTDVEAATSALIRTLALAGLGVLFLGGAATWWTVEGSLRPVDQMVETAEAIASGDLSRRVPDLEPGTELGRLGSSLNEMLTHIEHAVKTEKEGQERLRQFVADASHELRTPVTAISGYAELRRRGGLATPEEEDRAWSRIESEGHRMGSLVEDLLTLTRLGTGKPLHISEVDVAQVARNAAADHCVIDPERPVTVTGPESVLIRADEERLHQVLTSLLSNVRIHTPPWTSVVIDVADRDQMVIIDVADNGAGFPDAGLEHVFDRFYRADPSRSRQSGGSGLGLAIVEAIVTAHGGMVRASNVEDGGARITISLPRAPTPT
jgi:two-component system, OmpR family, sensor kinase